MQQVLRPYVAAGVALVGAGMVAVAPVAAPLPDVQVTRDVALTATDIDFTSAWQDAFSTAKDNFTTIEDVFSKAPAAALQQLIANQVDAIKGLSDGSLSFDDVVDGIKDHAQNLFQDTTLSGLEIDPSAGSIPDAITHTNDAMHSLALVLLPQFLPTGMDESTTDMVTQLVHALASPLSGALIGAMGPSISPLVAMVNSLTDINDALTGDAPDADAALQSLVDMPANMVNGLLNGSTLDLDALLPAINDSGLLPEGMELSGLSFAFGGLLSVGGTALELGGTDVGVDTGIGGSIFNSLGLGAMGLPINGEALGPLAALVNLDQIIAGALGWDGDGGPLTDAFDPTSVADMLSAI